MDYEKKYNEALERAKELLLGNEHSNTIRSYFEHIFPQLAESEDERIRKDLIAVFETIEGTWCGISVKGILAYLEKQKEQKPAWSEEDKRILKGIIGKIDHDQTYGVSKDEMLNFLKKL